MRRNARANRERILAAAETVFGASGELGSTEEVAERAGVGIATVFRHFATKEALIEATIVRQLNRLDERATKLAEQPNPSDAIRQLIATLIETSSTKLTLLSLVRENDHYPRAVLEATQPLQATINVILARANNELAVRDDVTADEFFVLVRGLAQAATTMPSTPETMNRAIEIVCRGLAPSG